VSNHGSEWTNGIADSDRRIFGESGVSVSLGAYCGDFRGTFELSIDGVARTSRAVTEKEMTDNNHERYVAWAEPYAEGTYCTKFILTHEGDGTIKESEPHCWEEAAEKCDFNVYTKITHTIDHDKRETTWNVVASWDGNTWCSATDFDFRLEFSATGDSGDWTLE